MLVASMVISFGSFAYATEKPATPPSISTQSEVNKDTGKGFSEVEVTAEVTQLNVTVPSVLPIDFDDNGNPTVAENAFIINKSYGPVQVNDVSVSSASGWTLQGTDYSFNTDKIGSKNYTVTIDGKGFTPAENGARGEGYNIEDGNNLKPKIDGINDSDTDKRHFVYSGKISPQSTAIESSREAIANVTFNIGWVEAEVRALNIAPSKTAIQNIFFEPDGTMGADVGNQIQLNTVSFYSDETPSLLSHCIASGAFVTSFLTSSGFAAK